MNKNGVFIDTIMSVQESTDYIVMIDGEGTPINIRKNVFEYAKQNVKSDNDIFIPLTTTKQ